jgi:uncharacterized protein with FMN-binding domain
MSRKRKILVIAVALVVVLAAVVVAMLTIGGRNQRLVAEAMIGEFDLSQVPDGTFQGKYNAFPVIAEVMVTVKDHVITGIDLTRHMNGQGEDAEVIPQKVVEAQSLEVDTVSGATYSSKVILLAIRDALRNAAGE